MPKDSTAMSTLRRESARTCHGTRGAGETGMETFRVPGPKSGLCEYFGIALRADLTRAKEPVEE
ncbi:hypothetical protein SAMN04488026_10198 [Aliiruegeria lutimaris]|uniref:Uncharacterized protein n=1 Tax=Aliiruegeria lutimaris TaxID=571298 RepID=A0A1G8UG08_9RHOB|nr:hypothetical protein SAMN04488026_10198 [Aliiruegeria lutimaris]